MQITAASRMNVRWDGTREYDTKLPPLHTFSRANNCLLPQENLCAKACSVFHTIIFPIFENSDLQYSNGQSKTRVTDRVKSRL